MKPRLFLTGPVGCGKSTAIRQALGGKLTHCGGFLTRRYREPQLHFVLESPDGKIRKTFLDFPDGKPEVDLSVFSDADLSGAVLLLDEIGGIELLDPEFNAALAAVLRKNIPVLGVLKGTEAAAALAYTLGLGDEYAAAASRLQQQLLCDPDTLVYRSGQYDETALLLARQWVEEYLYD